MSNYLLIHGNRHGKWAWSDVISRLVKMGHQAHAIDLPGHGEDPTPRHHINLQSYQAAVLDYAEKHNLSDIVLVGHSGGGATLAAVAGALRDRLSRVVFIAALIPLKGESLMDHIPAERHEGYREIALKNGDNSVPISYEQARKRYFEEVSEEQAQIFFEKLTPEPFAAMTSEVEDNSILELNIPIVCVICLNDRSLPLATCRKCAKRIKAKVVEIESGHNAMLSHPDEIVQILLAD